MQQHHTRLAAGERRAMMRITGRRPVTRVLLALAVVMLLTSGVWTQPAAAVEGCPGGVGNFDGDGRDTVVGTYTIPASPMSAVVVTLSAMSAGGVGESVITVSLISNFGTSGQTVLATAASNSEVALQLIIRSPTTFTATVNAASEPIAWVIGSRGSYCDSPPRTSTADTGVYYVDVWHTSFFVLPFHRDTPYTPDGVPAVLTIPVGATVRWRFRDIGTLHSIAFDDGSNKEARTDGVCGSFSAGVATIMDCDSIRQFTQPGTFTYHDGEHPEIVGTIIVTPPGVVVFR